MRGRSAARGATVLTDWLGIIAGHAARPLLKVLPRVHLGSSRRSAPRDIRHPLRHRGGKTTSACVTNAVRESKCRARASRRVDEWVLQVRRGLATRPNRDPADIPSPRAPRRFLRPANRTPRSASDDRECGGPARRLASWALQVRPCARTGPRLSRTRYTPDRLSSSYPRDRVPIQPEFAGCCASVPAASFHWQQTAGDRCCDLHGCRLPMEPAYAALWVSLRRLRPGGQARVATRTHPGHGSVAGLFDAARPTERPAGLRRAPPPQFSILKRQSRRPKPHPAAASPHCGIRSRGAEEIRRGYMQRRMESSAAGTDRSRARRCALRCRLDR